MIIAVAQVATHTGDLEVISQRMLELSRRASAEGADLLVMPAMVLEGLCGPNPVDLKGFRQDIGVVFRKLSQSIACPCLVLLAKCENVNANLDAVIVQYGDVKLVKSFKYMIDEHDFGVITFNSGETRFAAVFDWPNAELLQYLDANVVLFLSRHGFALDDSRSAMGATVLEGQICEQARESNSWIVGVGSLGCYYHSVYTGPSFAVSPRGELVALTPPFEEALMMVDLDSQSSEDSQHSVKPSPYNSVSFLWEALAFGFRDYIAKVGATDVVLALDGKVSSSVLAALVTDAIGPTHVLAFIDSALDEPGRHSVRRLAKSLHLSLREYNDCAGEGDSSQSSLFDATQLRLAAIARESGALPLSSIDKTFYALEARADRCYCSQIAPLGDVCRSNVVRLAQTRNTISPVLDPDLIASYDIPNIDGIDEVLPTAEARLEFVDSVISSRVESGMSVTEIVNDSKDSDLCLRVLKRMNELQNARAILPPSILVSSRCVRETDSSMGTMWFEHVRSEEVLTTGPDGKPLPAEQEGFSLLTESILSSPAGRELDGILGRLEDEMSRFGSKDSADKGTAEGDVDRQVSDLLEFIRDVVQSGENAVSDVLLDGPSFDTTLWESPFSEN